MIEPRPINGLKSLVIRVTGLVQGVGFRPFIYHLAHGANLTGEVDNRNDGVYIIASGNIKSLNSFLADIRLKAPLASSIDEITVEEIPFKDFRNFSIVKSKNISNQVTEISPDIAICPYCLDDLKNQTHRLNYPFINCTHCGPRFTIIRELPYDRPNTTMDNFPMCNTCDKEYKDIMDRRFHAQPVACNSCGPKYRMLLNSYETEDFNEILESVSDQLSNGYVIAIKGLGGYHLLCDARKDSAVLKLREIKFRESKPFAVMCKDLESAKQVAFISTTEENALISWRRPILLLDSKNSVSKYVSNGLNRIGVMLPYLPLHHLLFEILKTDCIVLTSGNLSEEPIVINDLAALKIFKDKTSSVITNNRDIHNRCDDSVAMAVNEKVILIRRSRGYAPSPIKISTKVEGVFGAGSELVNCFAMGKDKQVIMSQYIGDLKNAETFDFYKETFDRFSRLFRFKPEILVRDLHPDYLSSVFAEELAHQLDIHLFSVQHHHAHIVSCMAEKNIDDEVIGISMDGVGLGTDGQIWGGEFLVASHLNFRRIFHLEYIPISGSDRLPYEPWRSMVAYLYHYFGNSYKDYTKSILTNISKRDVDLLVQLIDKKINTWKYSSAGRLFDAVAALLNISIHAGFHAEAPMRLESIADRSIETNYSYQIVDNQISLKNTFMEILTDLNLGLKIHEVAGKFHNTIAMLIFDTALRISRSEGIKNVVLSGGTFQNKILLEKTIKLFKKSNMNLFFNQNVPANDGGIALGQIIIGARMREKL